MASDPYEELGIPVTASGEEIRAAYLGLARRFHPDRLGSEPATVRASAAARMAAVNAAWSVLGDPARRASYDASVGIEAATTSATIRDPGSSFRPLDDDDVDPVLIDDTPIGAAQLSRPLTFLPAVLGVGGAVVSGLGAMLAIGPVLSVGLMLLAAAGLAFLLLPLVALVNSSRADHDR